MAIMGRGSASTFGIIFLMCLLLQYETIHAATHVVGGKHKWTFNVADWPNGKTFNAGDVLGMKYSTHISHYC